MTDPRSPATGIRYANLLRRFLDYVNEEKKEEIAGEPVFSSTWVGKLALFAVVEGFGTLHGCERGLLADLRMELTH